MAISNTPPFRADHVGSFLRPPELHEARADFRSGKISHEALAEIEDKAILDVIAMQKDVGLKSVTDGELRRSSWHMDFIYELGGIEQVEGESINVHFKSEGGEFHYDAPAVRVADTVALTKTIFEDDFKFVRDNADASLTPKLTIPSPSMVHYRGGDTTIDAKVYPDLEQFWTDLANAYKNEVKALYELGCRYLQLDDTSLALVNDPEQLNHITEIGGDPAHLHEKYIATMNKALAGKPDDMTVTTHLCRGNNESMWAGEGSYDFVSEALFGDLNVDGYFLEFDDERSGGFEPLKHVPKGKYVVLGLITTKRADLEDRDLVKRRIDEAAKFCDLDQLCLSPQCGFSSTEAGNDLSVDDQKAKLQLVVEIAEEVWG